MAEYFDVIVVGAGLSGIDAAVNLRRRCAGFSFLVLERRESFGGTWDLFRYPGIRSDSDMFTFGFDFRPWTSAKPIASGAEIKAYMRGAIEDEGIGDKIRYGHHILHAEWSSLDQRWRLLCENGSRFECSFLLGCAGYYDYDKGYEPDFAGSEEFVACGGQIVHPQKWTPDIDVAGRRVVVIGSGATAITLIPSIAEVASHVTMLQRSPTYILPAPSVDPKAEKALKAGLSPEEYHRKNRERKVREMEKLTQAAEAANMSQVEKNGMFISFARMALPASQMSDEEFARHFTPAYNVWEQRLCLAPDGDFFKAIRRKKASIVTDRIDSFDGRGIKLQSGGRVDADIIVTATGLQMHANPPMATMEVRVDGKPFVSSTHHVYKDCMLSDVPNFVFIRGYFQGSWTLKADLISVYLCRLLLHMRERGLGVACPRLPPGGAKDIGPPPTSTISAGYLLRAEHVNPSYGTGVWAPLAHYPSDRKFMEEAPLSDEFLEFISRLDGDVSPGVAVVPGAPLPRQSRL